jgi:nucleotide-binding universal stress UspA family protein
MFGKILLAVDGSDPANRAAQAVADLAPKLGSEVLVLHAREREITWTGTFELETPVEAVDLVDRIVRDLKDAGVSARGEVREGIYGQAALEIVDTAKAIGADVIVMGTRGMSDLRGLLVGSVAHKVIHLAGCPVLVVR